MGRSLSTFAMDRASIGRMASSAAAVIRWRSVVAPALLSMLVGLGPVGNAHATLAPDGLVAGESPGHFGQSVVLSAGGNTALIGAPVADGEAGAVRVFTRTGSTWTEQAELAPKLGEEIGNGGFGSSVALSAEGNMAVIGDPGDDGGAGAAWAFTRSESGAWTQRGGKLTGIGEEGEGQFGSSVELSAKGSAALIGGPGDAGKVGAAWAFALSGETWSQQGTKLTGAGESGAGEFGRSVALSKEGTVALIGAPGDSGKAGAAWVFTASAEGAWGQQGGKLTGGEEEGEGQFGSSVALSADGDTVLVGGPADDSNIGAAWVFTRTEAPAWGQQGGKLTGGEEEGEGQFGSSVALSADGDTVLVGGPADDSNIGAAWVFTRTEAPAWGQQGGKLTGGEEEGEGRFGSSVALSADGDTVLIGGPADNTNVGAAWAFVNPPTVSNVTPNKGPEAGGTSVTITGTNFNEAAAVEFGSIGATSFEVVSATSITAVAPAGEGTVDVSVTSSGGVSATSAADEFSYVPVPTVVTKAASSITQTTATLSATVNPNGGDVSNCAFEYGTTEAYEASVPCSSLPGAGAEPVAVSAALENLSANTTYHFRIVATSPGGTSIDIFNAQRFETLPNAPTVVTTVASSLSQTSAVLNATVNPNGGTLMNCHFDYGTTIGYGHEVPCSSLPGSGASPVDVSASVTGLIKNTIYHFRIVAANTGGTSPGGDQTLETAPGPPTVIVGEPSAIGQTSAVLSAEINPNGGVVTQCYFHYEGGSSPEVIVTPCVGLPLSGKSPLKVSALAEGLSASTRYSFSLEVINSLGEDSFGEGGTSFETLPGPEVVTGVASLVTQTSATLNATVNPNGGEVSTCEFEYGTFESYGSKPVPCESQPGAGKGKVAVYAKLQGLSANTRYFFRIVATNPGGTSRDTLGQTLTTLPIAPAVMTGEASSVTQTSMLVNATVDENGGRGSDCDFEYGPTTSYGTSVPCTPSPESGTGPLAVSAVLARLTPDTTYHVRIVAANPGGIGTGGDHAFTTVPDAPTVLTGAASSVTQTSATLGATVNPDGGRVSACQFEYGTSVSYGSSVPCPVLPGAGASTVAVSALVGSLHASTIYHFRFVAVNSGGAGVGIDQTFTTATAAPVISTAPSTTTAATTTPTATTPVTPLEARAASCKTSLASPTVAVRSEDMVAVKLRWIGTGTDRCSGKLMLRAKVKDRGQRSMTMLIGAGSFSLPVGGMEIVRLKLDSVGRALLSAAHGRLGASLSILKLVPGPAEARTESVRLARDTRSSITSGRSSQGAHGEAAS
jgi:hypothetical protein